MIQVYYITENYFIFGTYIIIIYVLLFIVFIQTLFIKKLWIKSYELSFVTSYVRVSFKFLDNVELLFKFKSNDKLTYNKNNFV